jgi:hypothetical protein
MIPGLYAKRHLGNNKVATATIKLGSTKGLGSSTRKYTYCRQRNPNSQACIYQFINVY